jgi:hypothetical protein
VPGKSTANVTVLFMNTLVMPATTKKWLFECCKKTTTEASPVDTPGFFMYYYNCA